MQKRRLIALGMAALMAVGTVTGCGGGDEGNGGGTSSNVEVKKDGYPVVSESLTISALGYGEPGCGEWGDFGIFKEISEKTGINVEWETISGDGADEKLSLKLADASSLPNVIFSGLSTSQILENAKKGIIVPIEELIDEYAPNLKKILDERPEIRKAITMPDGHIYAVPAVNTDEEPVQTTTLNLNKNWLDELGLEIPTTTEEFEAVLRAFKEAYPNDFAMTFEPVPPYNVWNGDTGLSGAFGVTDSSEKLMMKDGELAYTPIEEGYKDYVKWLAKLYKEGLLDVELFTQDHNQYMAKISGGRVGAYLTNGAVKTSSAEYVEIEPLKGPNGDQLWSSLDFSIDRGRGVITGSNKNKEATMRWIDSFYEPLTSLKLQYGIYLKESGDQFEVLPTETGKPSQSPGAYVGKNLSKEVVDEYVIKTEDQIKADELKEMYRPFLNDPIPLVTLTGDESKRISTLSTDLSKVVDEKKAKWVSGQADIDSDWDAYVESLKKLGLDEYMEIYNTAIERYNKAE